MGKNKKKKEAPPKAPYKALEEDQLDFARLHEAATKGSEETQYFLRTQVTFNMVCRVCDEEFEDMAELMTHKRKDCRLRMDTAGEDALREALIGVAEGPQRDGLIKLLGKPPTSKNSRDTVAIVQRRADRSPVMRKVPETTRFVNGMQMCPRPSGSEVFKKDTNENVKKKEMSMVVMPKEPVPFDISEMNLRHRKVDPEAREYEEEEFPFMERLSWHPTAKLHANLTLKKCMHLDCRQEQDFGSLEGLAYHITVKHSTKCSVFQCMICGTVFDTVDVLRKHVEERHYIAKWRHNDYRETQQANRRKRNRAEPQSSRPRRSMSFDSGTEVTDPGAAVTAPRASRRKPITPKKVENTGDQESDYDSEDDEDKERKIFSKLRFVPTLISIHPTDPNLESDVDEPLADKPNEKKKNGKNEKGGEKTSTESSGENTPLPSLEHSWLIPRRIAKKHRNFDHNAFEKAIGFILAPDKAVAVEPVATVAPVASEVVVAQETDVPVESTPQPSKTTAKKEVKSTPKRPSKTTPTVAHKPSTRRSVVELNVSPEETGGLDGKFWTRRSRSTTGQFIKSEPSVSKAKDSVSEVLNVTPVKTDVKPVKLASVGKKKRSPIKGTPKTSKKNASKAIKSARTTSLQLVSEIGKNIEEEEKEKEEDKEKEEKEKEEEGKEKEKEEEGKEKDEKVEALVTVPKEVENETETIVVEAPTVEQNMEATSEPQLEDTARNANRRKNTRNPTPPPVTPDKSSTLHSDVTVLAERVNTRSSARRASLATDTAASLPPIPDPPASRKRKGTSDNSTEKPQPTPVVQPSKVPSARRVQSVPVPLRSKSRRLSGLPPAFIPPKSPPPSNRQLKKVIKVELGDDSDEEFVTELVREVNEEEEAIQSALTDILNLLCEEEETEGLPKPKKNYRKKTARSSKAAEGGVAVPATTTSAKRQNSNVSRSRKALIAMVKKEVSSDGESDTEVVANNDQQLMDERLIKKEIAMSDNFDPNQTINEDERTPKVFNARRKLNWTGDVEEARSETPTRQSGRARKAPGWIDDNFVIATPVQKKRKVDDGDVSSVERIHKNDKDGGKFKTPTSAPSLKKKKKSKSARRDKSPSPQPGPSSALYSDSISGEPPLKKKKKRKTKGPYRLEDGGVVLPSGIVTYTLDEDLPIYTPNAMKIMRAHYGPNAVDSPRSERRKQNLSNLEDGENVQIVRNGNHVELPEDLARVPVYLSAHQKEQFFSRLIRRNGDDPEGSHQCRDCRLVLRSLREGRRHVVGHIRVIRLRCSLCKVGSFFCTDMRNHLQFRHCERLITVPNMPRGNPGEGPCMNREQTDRLIEVVDEIQPGHVSYTSGKIISVLSLAPYLPDAQIEERIIGAARVPRYPPLVIPEGGDRMLIENQGQQFPLIDDEDDVHLVRPFANGPAPSERRKKSSVVQRPPAKTPDNVNASTPTVATSGTTTFAGPAKTTFVGPATTTFAGPAKTTFAGPATTTVAGPATTTFAGPAKTTFAGPATTTFADPATTTIVGPATTTLAGPMITTFSGPATTTLAGPVITTFSGPATTTLAGPVITTFSGPATTTLAGPLITTFSGPATTVRTSATVVPVLVPLEPTPQ